jgi:hypothetical protein
MRYTNTLAVMNYHMNTCWTAAKLDNITITLLVCSQYGQYTETMRHVLVDCQVVGPFWIDTTFQLSAILEEVYNFDQSTFRQY